MKNIQKDVRRRSKVTRFIFMLSLSTMMLFCGGCGEKEHVEFDKSTLSGTEYYVEDLMTCMDWVGKSYKEVGIPESYVVKEYGMVVLKGNLYGDGSSLAVAMMTDEGESSTFNRITITNLQFTYKEMKKNMIALYGEPSQEGERPYSTPEVTGTEKYSIFDLESRTIEFDYDKEDSRTRIVATSK